ncbi:MAG TPA: glutamate racemase [Oscillospiraceae bacterium]|nr:glutamate racemase [Oscillospiraceae bacterium]
MQKLAEKKEKPIAFFDSGVGGLSVLAVAVHCLPHEDFIYYGDTAHAPYGRKSKAEVQALSLQVAEILMARGCKALVVACNTATSAAVHLLREQLPIPVIGMEPAVKPALEHGDQGKVLVMATPLTLQEEKFHDLCQRCEVDLAKVLLVPCPTLVELVEQGCIAGRQVEQELVKIFAAIDTSSVATVVLGCTHYLFLKEALTRIFPLGVSFIDGNLGTVRQLTRVLANLDLLREEEQVSSKVELLTSGGESARQLLQKLYTSAYEKMEGLK